jgi:hypothetical protein
MTAQAMRAVLRRDWNGRVTSGAARMVAPARDTLASLEKRRFVQGPKPAGRLDHGLSTGGIACRSELNGSANGAQQSASQATRPDT